MTFRADLEDMLKASPPVFLHSLEVPQDLVILVLAPHPDDFDEIAITMRYFRDNGNPIYVSVLGSGANGVEDAFCLRPTREAKTEIRENEQRKSCQFFGLAVSHLRFLRLEEDRAGHIEANEVNRRRLRDHFLEIRPDIVFLPHGNDTNIGHQRTWSIFREIAPGAGYAITAFFNRDPKTISMRHDVYALFGEKDSRWKAQLLRLHESQQQRNVKARGHGLDERILRLNRKIVHEDFQLSDMYAEVFEIEFFTTGRR
jgi:LmbE family N-acetylglucosaminyl deacetylase